MTNIEKLYDLAKVDKIKTCYWNCKHSFPCEECCIYKDETVDFVSPPFTSEKQLELIKWLSIQRNGFLVLNPTDNKKEFLVGTNYYWGRCDTQTKKLQDFPQALAGLVCELWEDLTPKQREEIKRVLE